MLGLFISRFLALPQSKAAVERVLSKINNNKTNRLGVSTAQSIVCESEMLKYYTRIELLLVCFVVILIDS